MTTTIKEIEAVNNAVEAALYRIIVDPVEVKTESANGIRYTKETIEAQEYLRYYGTVMSIGPLAFGSEKFLDADGRRVRGCEVGDMIVYGRHTGIDIVIKEGKGVRRMRAINDDQVIAIIKEPDMIDIPLV